MNLSNDIFYTSLHMYLHYAYIEYINYLKPLPFFISIGILTERPGVVVININLDINLGNIWEMLSAVGTIGAVVTSLFLAFRESKPKINASISIGYKFGKFYQLVLTKNHLDSFTIVRFGHIHNCRKQSVNFRTDTHLKIYNSENKTVGRRFPYDFTEENIIKIVINDAIISSFYGKKVRFYVEDINGRVYRSNKVLIRDPKDE